MYKCPECETEINQASEICPHCRADLAGLAAVSLAAEPVPKRSTFRIILIWVIALAIIAGALYLFIWYVLPSRTGANSPGEAEGRAIRSLRAFQQVLDAYAKDEAGRYPSSPEVLGPPARMAARNALDAGYTLQYTPSSAGADGSIRTYSLTARPDRYGYRNFYTDQTRLLHATSENRMATAQDPAL
ncbi:MAG TPA: hypothetical protein VOA41_22170 [Candidatus Dormibacteraeota bacterium]|nr:hypothetical protein [Candidatus Dormibacteraeota bacterium]